MHPGKSFIQNSLCRSYLSIFRRQFPRRNNFINGRSVSTFSSSSPSSGTPTEVSKHSVDENDNLPPPMIDLAKWVDTTVTAMNGKVFETSPALIPVGESINFPIQDCYSLQDGLSINVPHEIEADVKVVMFSFRHYGFALLRSWLDALEQDAPTQQNKKSKKEVISEVSPSVKIIEICYIEAGILSMAKNMMAKSMRNKVETHRLSQSYIKFGGIMVGLITFYFTISLIN